MLDVFRLLRLGLHLGQNLDKFVLIIKNSVKFLSSVGQTLLCDQAKAIQHKKDKETLCNEITLKKLFDKVLRGLIASEQDFLRTISGLHKL